MAVSEGDRRRLHELLSLMSDAALDEARSDELRQLLADEDAQQYYVDFAMLDACLDLAGAERAAHEEPMLQTTAAVESYPVSPLRNSTAADATPSPVLGFLGGLTHLPGFAPTTSMIAVVLFCLVALVSVIAIRGIRVHLDGPTVAASKEPNLPSPTGRGARGVGTPVSSSPVARLVRVKDCRWNGHSPAPEVGQTLPSGKSLSLVSGVAEIEFDIGVKVILQSPAAFEVCSANSAKLEIGKATVEIQNERARGFKIRTPEATFIDQGTEFGVEVAPGGGSKVHVFKGLVDIDRNAPADQGRLL